MHVLEKEKKKKKDSKIFTLLYVAIHTALILAIGKNCS